MLQHRRRLSQVKANAQIYHCRTVLASTNLLNSRLQTGYYD